MSEQKTEERIYTVIREMFEQRGYSRITDKREYITARKQDGSKICMFKTIKQKVGVKDVTECIGAMKLGNIKHCVIVCEDITPATKNMVKTLPVLEMVVEIFNVEDVRINITKHSLVPKHEKLPDDEAKDFKKKYGVKIPVMLREDPIVKFYGYKRGNIIRVIRKNGTVAFRIVK